MAEVGEEFGFPVYSVVDVYDIIEYLEEDITSDRESYEKQFDDLFNAFAKISAIIQSRQTPLDRVKIEGFKNK